MLLLIGSTSDDTVLETKKNSEKVNLKYTSEPRRTDVSIDCRGMVIARRGARTELHPVQRRSHLLSRAGRFTGAHNHVDSPSES